MLSVSGTVLDAQDTSKGTFLFNQGEGGLHRYFIKQGSTVCAVPE